MTTIGIIGAGHIGSQVARAAIAVGYDIVIANSRGPETLAGLIEDLGPKARAATAAEAGAAGDFVVVTVPLRAIAAVPVDELAGKIVIDTNNYYFERDGHIDALDHGIDTVTGLLQAHLPQSRVAKGFNQIKFSDITTDGTPAGTPNRRALATSSNYPDAVALVTQFFDEIGFDTVDSSPLSESWRFDRNQPAYGAVENREQLAASLAAGVRPE